MTVLSKEQSASREKTLLAALLLSLWAPFTTGVAVLLSHSTTQLADFIRRTVELAALFISWWVFRFIYRKPELSKGDRARMENIANLSVAAAMASSALVMLVVALSRLSAFQPGGNVYPGLAIAGLGLVTNAWFWRRYTRLNREHFSAIIDTQRHLYRAKAFVDLCVILALAGVAIQPSHPATRYIDLLGSAAVIVYLLWSAARTARAVLGQTVSRQRPA